MTTPRENAEAAARYFADDTLECWSRTEGSNNVWYRTCSPTFNVPGLEYYVGHEPPPIKRTITLTVNGREWVLPEPLRVKPAHDEAVWILSIESWPITWGWYDCKAQNAALAAGQLYATKDDCLAWAEFDKCCRGGGV